MLPLPQDSYARRATLPLLRHYYARYADHASDSHVAPLTLRRDSCRLILRRCAAAICHIMPRRYFRRYALYAALHMLSMPPPPLCALTRARYDITPARHTLFAAAATI